MSSPPAAEPPAAPARRPPRSRSPSASTATGRSASARSSSSRSTARSGFFTRGGGAGRAGRDFVTSPEVGSLFGALRGARARRRVGAPGATRPVRGRGGGRRLRPAGARRAAGRARLRAGAALRARRAQSRACAAEQATRLPLEPLADTLGPSTSGRRTSIAGAGRRRPGRSSRARRAPRAHDRRRRPRQRAARQPRVRDRGAHRRRAGTRSGSAVDDDGTFREVPVPAADDLVDLGRRRRRARRAPGSRCSRGRSTGSTTARRAPAPRRGPARRLRRRAGTSWSRATAGGCAPTRATRAVPDPLDDPGSQDITVDVPLEMVRRAARRAGLDVAARVDPGRVAARPSGSTTSSRRVGPVGGRRGRAATSTRSPGAAGSPKPPRSPIRPGSARTPSSSSPSLG